MEDKQIAARYIGDTEVILGHSGGPYKDGSGNPLQDLVLRKGDTLMMRDSEVNGFTVKFDPRGQLDPEMIGVGRAVKPEHEGLNDDELFMLGYQFHQGREDFESANATIVDANPVDAAPAAEKKA